MKAIMKVLGIDFGTTSFSACVYDDEADQSWFAAGYNSSHKAAGLKREFRIDQVRQDLYSFIEKLSGEFSLAEIEAISVTGNMHSFFLVREGQPITDIITWQDERVLEEHRDGLSYVEYVNETFKPRFSRYQYRVSSGYAVTTLLHLLETGSLGAKGFAGCSLHFAPDLIVHELIHGSAPTEGAGITDHSLAHSSGLYDLEGKNWNRDLIEAMGYGEITFPKIAEPGTFLGVVGEHIPALRGVPVFLGMGDTQASVFGALMEDAANRQFHGRLECSRSVVLSMGTSGQVSAVVRDYPGDARLIDCRPFLDGRMLLVGATLACGRALHTVKDFIQSAARAICQEGISDKQAYEVISQCILPSSPLKFQTTLNGTREHPDKRGSISNIDLSNFTLQNVVTSAAYGIVEELFGYYQEMDVECDAIIGVGNALRKNAFLVDIVSSVFGNNVRLSKVTEAASFGAAACALRGLHS